MSFKWELTLGTVIQIILLLITVFGAARKFGTLETKLNIMYHWFEEVVLTSSSLTETLAEKKKSRDDRFFGNKPNARSKT